MLIMLIMLIVSVEFGAYSQMLRINVVFVNERCLCANLVELQL